MSTSVVRGCLEEVLSQVVGTDGLDVCAMMNGKILDSRMIVRSTFAIDSEEEVVRMCQGSGRVRNALRHVAGQCVKGATGVVRHGMICLSLLKGKGMGKWMLQLGHWVENRHLLQEMCRPELVKALQLLQSVLTPEDFSKSEKNVLSSVNVSFLRLWKGKPIMRNRNRSILK